MSINTIKPNGKLKAKDFATNQDVRWCPGCGDYSILKQVQTVMADLGLNKDEVAALLLEYPEFPWLKELA